MRAEHFKAVSVLDPGLDTERMPLGTMIAYFNARDIATVEPYMPAGKCVVFHCREVPHSLWSLIENAGTDEARNRVAFMCGVTRVDGLVQDDGVVLPSWSPMGKSGDVAVMTEAEINGRFSPSEWQEIGAVIYKASFFPRRMALTYQLPSLCREALAHRLFLSAEPSPTSAEQPSEKPSEPLMPMPVGTDSV